MDAELDLRNSHSRAKVAKQGRSNMRCALGIDASFVDVSSMATILLHLIQIPQVFFEYFLVLICSELKK